MSYFILTNLSSKINLVVIDPYRSHFPMYLVSPSSSERCGPNKIQFLVRNHRCCQAAGEFLAKCWAKPYSEVCGYVRSRLSIALARTTSMSLQGCRDPTARVPADPLGNEAWGWVSTTNAPLISIVTTMAKAKRRLTIIIIWAKTEKPPRPTALSLHIPITCLHAYISLLHGQIHIIKYLGR